ncbi:Adenosine monophosphate-protein transferase SoFic [Thiorhodovibrio winogradskyi]|uniref:Adenosine monophosphate-protein transferase SoFic n=1 Tax=Thiorhodovibrio winogradskyi TaxID=77007 RepID=A0ABZ0SDR9_9GAMM|nr:Fic family protein [Thiorhodovibrio winogradskyi]
MTYQPPFKITATILSLVEEIGEALGRMQAVELADSRLRLHRINRIKTIQASLEIEGNTLNLDQVTAVLDGKRVLAQPRELQEVRNAFAAYEAMSQWSPDDERDLLTAHGLLMAGLVDELGCYRSGSVGVHGAQGVIHVAPQASRVPGLMGQLLQWLAETDEHPLIVSTVFHYEFEFIHPFQDGNGRMGRLWQSLILSRWRSVFANMPVESLIRDARQDYYAALNACNQVGESTRFVEFMLEIIFRALQSASSTEQESGQVTEQVKRLLSELRGKSRPARALMQALDLKHRPNFFYHYLQPALQQGLVEMTRPDTPRARNQQYRLTELGRSVAESWK